MVAMETGNFLKMLNDASLASLGLLVWKVLGYIICKNPLWVLSCKVGPKIPVWLPDYIRDLRVGADLWLLSIYIIYIYIILLGWLL